MKYYNTHSNYISILLDYTEKLFEIKNSFKKIKTLKIFEIGNNLLKIQIKIDLKLNSFSGEIKLVLNLESLIFAKFLKIERNI